MRFIVAIIGLLIGFNCVSAQQARTLSIPAEKREPVHVPYIERPPVIDGKLDDAEWQQAAKFSDFLQIQPGDNIAPSQTTEVRLAYDKKNLYVAFHAFDNSGKVRATIARRDDIFADDNVSIYLDTFNDQRRAYAFFFNPLGVQADAIITEGQGEDFSVDVVMQSKGMLIEDGYTVEVAIPFKSLKYQAGKNSLWGLHLRRAIKNTNDETTSWMPISRDIAAFLNQAGHITGLEQIDTERTLELIPSMLISESGERRAGDFINRPTKIDPGVTLKLNLTSAITLDFTLRPDFAQVEADQTVITANQRFPIFFAERRPFFLERIDLFRTTLQVVNTRTIVDPLFATKLTGKRGRNTFGILLAADEAPGNFTDEERQDPDLLPSIARFIDKKAYIAVVRLTRDIGLNSNLGVIATSRSFIDQHNNLVGVDGRLRIDPRTLFFFELVGTNSRRFFYDADRNQNIYRTGNGLGYYFNYDFTGRHYGYTINGTGRTSDYRADVGFTRRTNNNSEVAFLRLSTDPNPDRLLTRFNLFNTVGMEFNFQGRTQSSFSDHTFNFNFKRETFFNINFNFGYERVFEEEFGPRRSATQLGAFFGSNNQRSVRGKGISLSAGTTPSKRYSGEVWFNYNTGVLDFDFGAGPKFPRVSPEALTDPNALLDPGAGNALNFGFFVVYQPTDALRVSLNYNRSRLTRIDTGRVAFDDNIYSLRATYQFTRNTFLRTRIDYDSLSANINEQFILGWTPNPGTSLFVGYNDNLNYNGFSPFTGDRETGFRRNRRTFFIKLSYLFRFSI